MKRHLMWLCSLMLVFGLVGSASAAPYTFDMGTGSSVDTSGTNSALTMFAEINPLLDDIIFDLEVGESNTFQFATIGTEEEWVNNDDLDPGYLEAQVDFDNPDILESIGGQSIGFIRGLWGYSQGWTLSWEDPVTVNFSGGGQFTLALSDVGHESWWWQGPEGTADVWATVTYDTAPVPEPSTILLMGAGLLGLVAYNRKRFLKSS